MEFQGPQRTHSQVRNWVDFQPEQHLIRDPTEADRPGDQRQSDCEDMLVASPTNSASGDQCICECNSESSSHDELSEDGDTDVAMNVSDSDGNFTDKQWDHVDKNSVVYESVNDAVVPFRCNCGVDYSNSVAYDNGLFTIYEHECNTHQQTVYGQGAVTKHIVYRHDVVNEPVTYIEYRDAFGKQFLFTLEDARINPVVNGQGDALNEEVWYIQDDVLNEQVVNGQLDVLNVQVVNGQLDVLNEQVVNGQLEVLNEHVVNGQNDLNEVLYIEEDVLNFQVRYGHGDDLNEQVINGQDDLNEQVVKGQEDLWNEQDVDDDPFQLNQMEGDNLDVGDDLNDEEDDFLEDEEPSEDSGFLDKDEAQDHGYGDYWHQMQHYDPGSDADSGIYKMF